MRILFLSAFFLLQSTAITAQPDNDKEELVKQQNAIKRELAELQGQLNQIKGTKQKSIAELRFIQDKILARQRLIGSINREVNYIERDMGRTQGEISRLNLKLDTLKAAYGKSIVYAYKNRNNYDFLTFIFSANSFNEALKRIQYLKSYREYRARQASDIRKYKEFLQGKRKELDVKKQQKSSALQNQTVEMQELAGEKVDLDETVKQLSSKEKNIGGVIAKIRKKQGRIQNQIAAIIKRDELARKKAIADEKKRLKALEDARIKADAEARRLAAEKNKPKPGEKPPADVAKITPPKPREKPPVKKVNEEDFGLAPAEASLNAEFEKNRGGLPWPIEKGYISMHFGLVEIGGVKFPNQSVTFETQQPGATVKAVFNGEVSAVSNDEDGTQTVFIRHGNYITVYGNLASASVQKGQQISTGQSLGRTASSVEGTGRGQLEFMMNKGQTIVNPEGWLRSR